jgi:hypothetical protein
MDVSGLVLRVMAALGFLGEVASDSTTDAAVDDRARSKWYAIDSGIAGCRRRPPRTNLLGISRMVSNHV